MRGPPSQPKEERRVMDADRLSAAADAAYASAILKRALHTLCSSDCIHRSRKTAICLSIG